MNHYESEYGQLSQRKSASIKKIEDEYSQMKAALLSSMDSEDELSDDERFDKDEPKIWEGSIPKPTERDHCPTSKDLSGRYKTTPSIDTNLDSSENHQVLSNSHGTDNQVELESKLKLGSSSNADIAKHEDVLDRKTSCDGSYGVHFSKGRFCFSLFMFFE